MHKRLHMAKQKRMITKQAKKLQNDLNQEYAQREYFQLRLPVWKALKVHKDIKALSAVCGKTRTGKDYTRQAITNALYKGIGSIALLTSIDNYFKTRENAAKKD